MKCVIFDLDGTLLYTLEDLWISVNFALDKLGYNKRALDEVRNFVGNGVKKLIERSLPQGVDEKEISDCLEIFKEHYSKNSTKNTRPYDGVIEILQYLRSKNVYTAVNSNKFDAAVKDLCDKYFKDLILFSVGESPNCAKKPSPEGVYKILEQFNISKKDAIYIGDSLVDINTAKNAQIQSISVCWGYCDKELLIEQGAFVVSTKEELKFKLDEFINKS